MRGALCISPVISTKCGDLPLFVISTGECRVFKTVDTHCFAARGEQTPTSAFAVPEGGVVLTPHEKRGAPKWRNLSIRRDFSARSRCSLGRNDISKMLLEEFSTCVCTEKTPIYGANADRCAHTRYGGRKGICLREAHQSLLSTRAKPWLLREEGECRIFKTVVTHCFAARGEQTPTSRVCGDRGRRCLYAAREDNAQKGQGGQRTACVKGAFMPTSCGVRQRRHAVVIKI